MNAPLDYFLTFLPLIILVLIGFYLAIFGEVEKRPKKHSSKK